MNFQRKMQSLCVILCLCSTLSWAQGYTTTAGIRVGTPYVGLMAQHVFAPRWSASAQLETSFKGKQQFSLLAQRHFAVVFKGLNYYVGGGWRYTWGNDFYTTNTQTGEPQKNAPTGPMGIVGVELRLFKCVVDWSYRPSINLIGGDQILAHQTGLSLRYILVPKKKKPIFKNLFKKKKKRARK